MQMSTIECAKLTPRLNTTKLHCGTCTRSTHGHYKPFRTELPKWVLYGQTFTRGTHYTHKHWQTSPNKQNKLGCDTQCCCYVVCVMISYMQMWITPEVDKCMTCPNSKLIRSSNPSKGYAFLYTCTGTYAVTFVKRMCPLCNCEYEHGAHYTQGKRLRHSHNTPGSTVKYIRITKYTTFAIDYLTLYVTRNYTHARGK
jgi:hypothetical protein